MHVGCCVSPNIAPMRPAPRVPMLGLREEHLQEPGFRGSQRRGGHDIAQPLLLDV